MKNLLLVDDEKSFLLSLEDMLKDNDQNYSVRTANNGKEAVNILENENIDLVVTDLKMPEMDGFDLIAYISGSKPNMPVIAMTAFGTPDMEHRLMEMGAFQYIEKPIDFPTLLNKIKDGLGPVETPSGKSDGRVAGISIASFIQLLELDQKTCTLNVTCGSDKGQLYFREGELLDASFGNLEGQDAALQIISWENTEIEIQNTCAKTENKIEVPLGFILLESARVRDERSGRKEEEPEEIKPPEPEPIEQAAAEPAQPEPAAPVEEEVIIEEVAAAAPEPAPAQPAPAATVASTGNPHVDEILAAEGVNRLIIISRDGTIVAQKNIDSKLFGTFTAYVAIAGEQFKKNMGFNGPRQIILTQGSDEKLLVLPGPNIVVGIDVASGYSPDELAKKIRPAVAQAKTK